MQHFEIKVLTKVVQLFSWNFQKKEDVMAMNESDRTTDKKPDCFCSQKAMIDIFSPIIR